MSAPESRLGRRRRYDILTNTPEQTVAFGRELAPLVRPPCLVLLEGELGSGKTALAKGIAAGLGAAAEGDVTSPTFALVHEYSGATTVYHIDLYRIEGLRDLATLGLDEMLLQDATVIVEWGERWVPHAPAPRVEAYLEDWGDNRRHIIVDEVGPGFNEPSHPSSIEERE